MTSPASSKIILGLSLLLSAAASSGCAKKCPPPKEPLPPPPAEVRVVEKPVPCMAPMTSNIPDDSKWIFTQHAGTFVDGVTGEKRDIVMGAGVLPPTELAAVFTTIEYLIAQLAGCRAIKAAH